MNAKIVIHTIDKMLQEVAPPITAELSRVPCLEEDIDTGTDYGSIPVVEVCWKLSGDVAAHVYVKRP